MWTKPCFHKSTAELDDIYLNIERDSNNNIEGERERVEKNEHLNMYIYIYIVTSIYAIMFLLLQSRKI